MVRSAVALRPMVPEDGEALAQLALASPDTGMIQIAPRYHLDAYQATLALFSGADTVGFVAEDSATEQIVGSGFLSFDCLNYEGQLRECAWLHNLQVHPAYRKQGIATRLAERRVARGRERVGENGVIAASIQQGNTGSFKVAQTWCQQLVGEVKNGAVGMRQKPPRPLSGVRIRAAEPEDLPLIADELNRFYDTWNFYVPRTGQSLAEWLAQTPFDSPFRHYYVAEDNAGHLLAGIAVVEECRIADLQVEHLPMILQLLNKVVKLVPQDGTMRQLAVSKMWYAPGELETARHLWETVRWQWRDRGSTITFAYDPKSTFKEIFKTPLWIPQTSFTYAVSGPTPMREDSLISTD
jgi:GNAT superfamily N-acetyltransferase